MKLIGYIAVYCFFVFHLAYGQQTKIDSLRNILKTTSKNDTTQLWALEQMILIFRDSNPDTVFILAKREMALAGLLPPERGKKWIANALACMCRADMYLGRYNTADESGIKALKLFSELGDKAGMANCHLLLGFVAEQRPDYLKALSHYLKGLKYNEEIKDRVGIGNSCANIGVVFYRQMNYTKAHEYLRKAIGVFDEIKDERRKANCFINLGILFYEKLKYDTALVYFFNALKITEPQNDVRAIAACYTNIGNIYADQLKYKESLTCYLKVLHLNRKSGDKYNVASAYVNLSSLYYNLKDYRKSITYADSAMKLSTEIGDVDNERLSYGDKAKSYFELGKFKEAYENHVKYKFLTDSIFNQENSRQLGDLKTQFEVEKRAAELKVKSEAEQEKLKAVASEEKKRQTVIIGAVAGILLIVIIFSLFLFNRFRITQRQKIIIEKQKEHVDKAYEKLHEKNKEVMDSINYASRIQRALLPSKNYIANQLSRMMKK